jgi:tRNA (guanine37-N1)-methyltransferase
MGVLQWCLQVRRNGAEEKRQFLLTEGLLDRNLKIRSEGDMLLLPVIEKQPGAIQAEFEAIRQKAELPRHELVGGIAIMQEDDKVGAATILSERPSVHTALYAESSVEGEFRTKRFRVIAGEDTTATTYTEYGHTFRVDLQKAYFSARLSSERQRIVSMMHEGEEVLDMFAGVGPFAVMLAQKAQTVWACDLNPEAIPLLIDNIRSNRVKNVVPILADAAMLPGIFGRRFDRIIMNLPLMADRFLPAAFSLCKIGGTIHYYALVSDDEGENPLITQKNVKSAEKRFVRSYAPGKSHMVYDIEIT